VTEFRLFLLQRITAVLLAGLAAAHLVVIAIATHEGLSAASILARTRSSLAFPAVYAVFALAAATHAAIGLRVVAREQLGWRGSGADASVLALWAALAALGLRAVAGIA
jgi:fumarate reductase subunit C